ncbi:hypothetical protein ACVWZW_000756 [Bradyrhizobium sp. F1.13.4]
MVATAGIWIENVSHAARAFAGLFTAKGLEASRARRKANVSKPRTPCFPNKERRGLPISKTGTPPIVAFYQLAGSGQRTTPAESLLGLEATRQWLEERLGPLARFSVVEETVTSATAATR